ncbi:MAG: NAD(P)H-quinone oxidoreductase [Tatlockia sp.]|nr:NAD(P)H-quinone oxidoreductase [Tatlockia sp.]
MRYISIDNPGSNNQLRIDEGKVPICRENQLLIRVRATAVNRADLMQRQGKYPAPPGESTIPGLEVAGDVVSLGNSVLNFKVGDRIYGLVSGGGYADYCCVEQQLASIIPDNWDYGYAAAIPEALMTTQATVFSLGELKKNEIFFIHAAGSGISSFAIQMASLSKAKVYSTSSNHEKIAKAKALGATEVFNYKTQNFAELMGDNSVDLIVDFIGGDNFPKHLKLLKTKGRLVQIACMQGHQVGCDLASLMRKRLSIMGFVLRPQSIAEKAKLWTIAQQKWLPYLLNKDLAPIIDSEFKFNQIELAHAKMLSSDHFGKIVIRL